MRYFLTVVLLLFAADSATAQSQTYTPICLGTNDTAAFQSIITAAASNPRTIRIPHKDDTAKRCALNTITIPSYITLDNTDGSGINRLSGQTITVQGPIVNPVGKTVFFGAGSTVFTSNASVGENGQLRRSNGEGVDSWSIATVDDSGLLAAPIIVATTSFRIGGTATGLTGELPIYEHPSNGDNYKGFTVPAIVTNSTFFKLPDTDPVGPRALSCDVPSGGVSICTWTNSGGGDMELGAVQENTALKTFVDGTLKIKGADYGAVSASVPSVIIGTIIRNTNASNCGQVFIGKAGSPDYWDELLTTQCGPVGVPLGGSGNASLTAYAIMTGGTTSTGAMQQVSGVGTAGQALLSNGAGALPSWQALPGGGDMILASVQAVTGAKTFGDTKFLLRNVAGTFNGSFVNTNTADRIYTLKDAAGTIAFTSDITGTNSGTNTGDNAVNSLYSGLVSNATHTGEVTGATALTITNAAVTLAKMADMATASFLGRNTAATGVPEVLSIATAKTMLAVNNVDNTSDAGKPVSTAQQTALDLKANLASPTLTGTPSLPSGTIQLGSNLFTAIAAPGTPAAGKGSVYVDSTSKNLAVKDDAGVVKHGVQTKTAVSNSFATAVDDAGVVTVAQPAFTNISGTATDAQIPDILTVTKAANLTTNGFVQTSGSDGTLSVSAATYPTNSAGANVIPKSDGTNLVASRITDDGNVTDIGDDPAFRIRLDDTVPGAGSTIKMGAVNGTGSLIEIDGSGTVFLGDVDTDGFAAIQLDPSAKVAFIASAPTSISLAGTPQTITLTAPNGIIFAGAAIPDTAGGRTIGTGALPFSSVYIGGAATNNIQLTGTGTAARVATFPDATTKIPIATQVLTFAGPTAARTITFPDAAITVARTDAANTFTGVQTMTSPAITTPAFSGTWTGTYTIGGTPTLAAATWSGTQSAGGNQLNNVIIGTTTPLAGLFTTVSGSTSVTSPIVTNAGALAISTTASNGNITLTPNGTGVINAGKALVLPNNSLTDNGTTIATDASLGNNFRVTALTANVTLSNPTNATDGQVITFEVIQNASAAKTLAFGSNFQFGAEITACTISATLSSHNFITAIYNSTMTKWLIRGCLSGY